MPSRLKSLDWLRGLMALSIMLYHLGPGGDATTLLGKLGIYGVSIFFILSGLSMAIAYDRYIKNLRTSCFFLVRRLFRIWPLFWLAVTLVAIPAYLRGKPFSVITIGLNLSTLFGFIAPTRYINEGAWSIGNELVYYAFTPLLITGYHYRRWLGNSITVVAIAIGVFFAFRILTPAMSLASQWPLYINPLNNVFLYCIGVTLYYNYRDVRVAGRWCIPLLLATAIAFVFYPSGGDQISIAAGFNRIAFSLLSTAIVFAFWKGPWLLPGIIGEKCEQLGIATYGVYLLHPIVMQWTRKGLGFLGIYEWHLFMFLVVGITIPLALLTFRFIEFPLITMGKHVTRLRPESVTSQRPVRETGAHVEPGPSQA